MRAIWYMTDTNEQTTGMGIFRIFLTQNCTHFIVTRTWSLRVNKEIYTGWTYVAQFARDCARIIVSRTNG